MNIIVTLVSGNILFLKESSMIETPSQVTKYYLSMCFCLRKSLASVFALTLYKKEDWTH